MNITPEMIKVVAKGMGYIIFGSNSKSITVWNGVDIYSRERYKPHLTNAEQCMELQERLLKELKKVEIKKYSSGVYINLGFFGDTVGEGKTINEAVVLAAYEYFKGKS